MNSKKVNSNTFHYLLAWAVHAFTASGAFIGLLTLVKIHQQQYISAFWLMGLAVLIDAVDGSMARLIRVKEILPGFDGTLLDNIVDYINYVLTPSFFLLVHPNILPSGYGLLIACAIAMTSSYQFCQDNAKTPDHFFKGFPSYWNFTVFYLFIFNTSPMINAWILSILCILIFVPIKYVYPSRLDYLTQSKPLKILMHICFFIYGISNALILVNYPHMSKYLLAISLAYVLMYLMLSVYRTFIPMVIAKLNANKRKFD